MTNYIKTAMVLALGLTATAGTASFAQGASCANRDIIVERLADKYGETRQSAGLNQNNGIVEIFASAETGTWTILVTMPTGVSCLMAAGKAWEGMADADAAILDQDA
jgi:hypothetical protein